MRGLAGHGRQLVSQSALIIISIHPAIIMKIGYARASVSVPPPGINHHLNLDSDSTREPAMSDNTPKTIMSGQQINRDSMYTAMAPLSAGAQAFMTKNDPNTPAEIIPRMKDAVGERLD